jgi:hypothetical protein
VGKANKKKLAKDSDMPKRPPSAYLVFMWVPYHSRANFFLVWTQARVLTISLGIFVLLLFSSNFFQRFNPSFLKARIKVLVTIFLFRVFSWPISWKITCSSCIVASVSIPLGSSFAVTAILPLHV